MKIKLVYKKMFLALLIIFSLAGTIIMILSSGEKKENVTVSKGDIVEGVYGTGTVIANKMYNLRSGALNTITNVHIREGDHVKKGSPLLELDGKEFQAPFEGTVTYFPYKVGENIFPQVTVLSIIDFTDRYLVVDLEQEAAIRVKIGQEATLSFDSIRQQSFKGRVESIYSRGQIFLARIAISHLPQEILPGMTADVAIVISVHRNAVLVPIVALSGDEVYVRGGFLKKSKPVKVQVGISDDKMVEILKGDLRPGDKLEINLEQGK